MLELLLLLLLGCCAGLHRDSSVFRLHVSKAAPVWHHHMGKSSSMAWQYMPCTPSLRPCVDIPAPANPTDKTAAL